MTALGEALVAAARRNPHFEVRDTNATPPAPKPKLVAVPANIFEALSNKALKLLALEIRQTESGVITVSGQFAELKNAVITTLERAQDFVLQSLFQKALARNARVSVQGSGLGQRLMGRQLTAQERFALDSAEMVDASKEIRQETGIPLYE